MCSNCPRGGSPALVGSQHAEKAEVDRALVVFGQAGGGGCSKVTSARQRRAQLDIYYVCCSFPGPERSGVAVLEQLWVFVVLVESAESAEITRSIGRGEFLCKCTRVVEVGGYPWVLT